MWTVARFIQSNTRNNDYRLAEKEGLGTLVKLNGRLLDNLCFADDIDLLADMKESLQDLTNRVDKCCKRMGLKINAEKTKTMAIGKQHEELQVRLRTGVLEQVTRFVSGRTDSGGWTV